MIAIGITNMTLIYFNKGLLVFSAKRRNKQKVNTVKDNKQQLCQSGRLQHVFPHVLFLYFRYLRVLVDERFCGV